MIFVTVGTERFPFDRLLRSVDKLCDRLGGEPVFMQTGHSTYRPQCTYQAFLEYDAMQSSLREARIVVSHAGAGSLLQCASLGKIPIMMAREKRHREHVDDHQRMLAERMADRAMVLLARNEEELEACVLDYDARIRRLARPTSAVPKLEQYLERIVADGKW